MTKNIPTDNPHPSLDIVGALSDVLANRRLVLALTGSVAVVRAVEMARLLMRHGAQVYPVMSHAATELIHPNLLHWATGNLPVTELSGEIEHVALAGNTATRADAVVVAPATANTIGKIAAGIDDTAVTTFVTTAIGQGIPVIVVPAMHEPMYRHPIVQRNMATLVEIGIDVLMPRVEEGKAKIADDSDVLAAVVAALDVTQQPSDATSQTPANGTPGGADGSMHGRRLLITVGRTVEYIDPIRVLTNNSTGKMGMALARAALRRGAEVTVVYGKGSATEPDGARVVSVETAQQMRDAVFEELGSGGGYDAMIAAAAVGDWRPVEQSGKKISTKNQRITLELEPTPKIIDSVKAEYPSLVLVAFRAQHDLSKDDLLADARSRREKACADLIAVNDVGKSGAGFGTDTNEMYLIDSSGRTTHIPLSSKDSVATLIVDEVARLLVGCSCS